MKIISSFPFVKYLKNMNNDFLFKNGVAFGKNKNNPLKLIITNKNQLLNI